MSEGGDSFFLFFFSAVAAASTESQHFESGLRGERAPNVISTQLPTVCTS